MDYKAFFDQMDRGEPGPVYLLHGEEEYAKDRAVERLTGLTDPAMREFNLSRLTAPSVQEILAAAEQLPLMDGRRVVLVRDCPLLGDGAAEGDPKLLTEYLKNPNPTTVLAFVRRGKCDSRRALYKAIAKAGGEVLFDRLPEQEAARWAADLAKRKGGSMGLPQARRLVMMTGGNLMDLASEVTKLCDYAGGAPITDAMLDACVSANLEYSVFAMMEDFLAGRIKAGMEALRSTLREGGMDAVLKTLGFVSSRLRLILQGREALDRTLSPKQAAAKLPGNPYAAQKAVEAAKKLSASWLEEALVILADVDYAIKNGRDRQGAALEQAMLQIFVFRKK